MDRHFDEELKELKAKILRMGSLVESQIQGALRALTQRDSALARRVIENDHGVSAVDVEGGEKCLRVLAFHQGAAGYLRLLTPSVKIYTELAHMRDLAEHCAARA